MTQGSIREIKNNPQVHTTKRVWKSKLQVKYNTQEDIGEIKNNPQV